MASLLRLVRHSLLPLRSVKLAGESFRVVAQTAGPSDRDYPLLRALAATSKVSFDVGGNVGLSTLLLARGGGRVVHIEASEFASRLARRNLELNALDRSIVWVVAVASARSGQLVDFYADGASAGNSTIEGFLDQRRGSLRSTTTLDDIAETLQTFPDLVKIDVEGHEVAVLEGMSHLLSKSRPRVLVELHSHAGGTIVETGAAVAELATAAGYTTWYCRTREPLVPDELGGRGRTHVVLEPSGKPFPRILDGMDLTGL